MDARDFDKAVSCVWEQVLGFARRELSLSSDEKLAVKVEVSGGKMTAVVVLSSERWWGEYSRKLSAPVTVEGGLLDLELAGLPDLTEVEKNAFVLLADPELTRSQSAVRTVGQLVRLGRRDLLKMRGVGVVTVMVVERVLARLGLWLGARVAGVSQADAGGGV
ncbi:MAG TPA: hypothetical protein VMS77_09900 [Conexivisphaerales archaeon]|nr:hypothetical protein [Conexivisphaerales archaeon]